MHSHTPFTNLAFCVRTFGCQMNKHDSERICGMLEGLGALPVESIEEADIVVFMTCCVREAADTRLYGQVASLKNLPLRVGTPLSKRIVAVGGCIGQRDGEKLAEELRHLDVVFGTHNLGSLPHLLEAVLEEGGHQVEVLDASTSLSTELPTTREHAWAAWLPIAVGCNNFCSYCIVPYVRGREKSRPLEDIVAEAERYVAAGVKEITLLGQNVNSYGRDLYGNPRFAAVLDALDQTGIERLRFATSHPKDLTDEVIEKFASLRSLMPSLHLPVQSGSDAVLAAMNRRYSRSRYMELIAKLRSALPDIALSTDIIVGFPGETKKDFEDTYRLVDEVGYHQVFTFIYSKREGTPAARLEDPTPREVVQERFDRLVDLVQARAFDANQRDLGSTIDVLVEGGSKRDALLLSGKSPKNQTVHAPLPTGVSADELAGSVVKVRIDEAKTWYLSGEVVEGPEAGMGALTEADREGRGPAVAGGEASVDGR
ncbi:MAG: tRNA (N6-isopentenyl adenosine(37)-C2)-methylthiotransferase MiaB [Gordonibacter sp.]